MSNLIFRKDGTAQGVAKQRLIESIAKPNKRVIYDPYAQYFVIGASIIKLLGHKISVWLGDKIVQGMHEHLICRTRFIDDLIEYATQTQFKYVHKWSQNDLIIWDNRQTMHRARAYDDLKENRDMRRTTVLGEEKLI